jgi:spoIIIJ-associated protein
VESIEASSKSVEEAIAQALSRLGRRREEVDVAILQEPSRGAFGLGSRDARVRVTVRAGAGSSGGASAIITPELADAILGSADIDIPLPEEEGLYEEEAEEYGDDEEEDEEDREYEDKEEVSSPALQPLVEAVITSASGEIQNVEHPSREDIEITVDVLQHVLRYMSINATVQVRSTNPLTLNIRGVSENLGLLIGRRGETLAALQLLINLIVSHRTKHRMRIIVDAENYRERREENLRSLALRVAQQVRSYRRSIALEAMPPHERRIVHISLAESKDISTESIGEGEERRVVISLKRLAR